MPRSEVPLHRFRALREWAPEIAAVLAFALVAALLRSRGLRFDAHALRFTLIPMIGALPRLLLLGVALQIVLALVARRAASGYLRAFIRPSALAGWIRFCAVMMIVTLAYTWLKVCVPLLTTRLLDEPIWRLDQLLHLGFSPNVFVVELLAGSSVLRLLDLWYSFWVVTVMAAMAWGATLVSADRRRNFALASALVWSIGSWGYLAVPASGPCYAFPEVFADSAAETPHAASMQARLARNYALMIAGREGSLRQFNPYLGVAAMPSLHVGAHWLFALWARRHARRWFWPLAAATALTFLGSLATGWHYAVDGYAGMLLAWLAIVMADRLVPVPSQVPSASEGGKGSSGGRDPY